MDIQNYRGVSQAFIVNVLEGDGTEECPKRIERYILEINKDGKISTTGKIVELNNGDRRWIGEI